MSGSELIGGGDVNDNALPSDLVAVQGAATHVGASPVPVVVIYNGSTVSFDPFSAFIADAGLQAVINANYPGIIVWTD